ncbi:barstar family protein [Neobacillus bataviensis]|uniref:barstar family protein n=1 Tax=Neobacillus bataviensis TaxID=220685 RepID=UPI001CC0A18B|nr:barstar family protein [Neobacillus bataviensis]
MNNERESIVTIDVSNVETKNQLHLLLKEKLEFPDFYGENWDAFWDAITGLVSPLPKKIIFMGWSELEKNLPRDTKIMKECLRNYNNDFPSWKSEFLFN